MNRWQKLEGQIENSDTDGQKMVRRAQGMAPRRERACADLLPLIPSAGGFLTLKVWKDARAQSP